MEALFCGVWPSPDFSLLSSRISLQNRKKCRFEPTFKKARPARLSERKSLISSGFRRVRGLQKRPQNGHPRHNCIKDSKSGSRASGSWVRIPPYPPRSRQQSVFPAAGVSFCAKSNRRPISAARRRPITDHLCGIYSEGDARQTTFAVYTAKAMKRLVRGTSAKVTHQLHEPSQSMGSVSVTGKNIDMKKVVWFVRSAKLASNFEVYPKTDGTVCMTFTFHGLARPIE